MSDGNTRVLDYARAKEHPRVLRLGRSLLLATAFVAAHLVLAYWSETALILHFHQFTMAPGRGSLQQKRRTPPSAFLRVLCRFVAMPFWGRPRIPMAAARRGSVV